MQIVENKLAEFYIFHKRPAALPIIAYPYVAGKWLHQWNIASSPLNETTVSFDLHTHLKSCRPRPRFWSPWKQIALHQWCAPQASHEIWKGLYIVRVHVVPCHYPPGDDGMPVGRCGWWALSSYIYGFPFRWLDVPLVLTKRLVFPEINLSDYILYHHPWFSGGLASSLVTWRFAPTAVRFDVSAIGAHGVGFFSWGSKQIWFKTQQNPLLLLWLAIGFTLLRDICGDLLPFQLYLCIDMFRLITAQNDSSWLKESVCVCVCWKSFLAMLDAYFFGCPLSLCGQFCVDLRYGPCLRITFKRVQGAPSVSVTIIYARNAPRIMCRGCFHGIGLRRVDKKGSVAEVQVSATSS